MISIKSASELNDNIRNDMVEIFIEGFSQWLFFFSKDIEKLKLTFRHIFQLDKFYIAFNDEIPIGIAGCTESVSSTIKLIRKEFIKHLGFVRGVFAHYTLNKEFEKKYRDLETE